MEVLDDLDRQLLRLLREDARRSFRTLAQMAGSTPPTVAARVRRMEQLGIIQGYTVRLDADRFTEPDVEQVVRLECHWCGRPTAEPHWARLDDRPHPFCCTTCRQSYLDKHERLKSAL